jgi:hypothetical protein
VTLILVGKSELWDRLGLQLFAAIRQRIDLQCCYHTTIDLSQVGANIQRQMAVCTHCLIYGSQNKHRINDDHMQYKQHALAIADSQGKPTDSDQPGIYETLYEFTDTAQSAADWQASSNRALLPVS